MAAQWTIYSSHGEYLASLKEAEHAGMLLSCLNDPGATIRLGRGKQIAWTDGVDGNASESFDLVAFHLADWADAKATSPTFICQCCAKAFPCTLDADGLWYTYQGGHFAIDLSDVVGSAGTKL
jgi:hypothetical protein